MMPSIEMRTIELPAVLKRLPAVGRSAIGLVFALSLALALAPLTANAASTVDTFSFTSPELEKRYRGLIAEIRCPKCQNVNIAGSDAPIAKDLRVTVHRLLGEGRTDREILHYLQERYGDFVLYDPPLRGGTLLLWLVPGVGFLAALWVVVKLARRAPADAQLSHEESQRLDALLASALPCEEADPSGDASGDTETAESAETGGARGKRGLA